MTQVAIRQFDNEQLALIKNTVAKGTTNEEFSLFIEVCKYHGLNPFARQIYAVVRNGKNGRQLSIQTSIDGYRLLAERSGKYAGQLGPEWCGDDGVWRDVWLSSKAPAAARIGVLRKDFNQPTWGIAKYSSYAQSSPLWDKMPDTMLAKCAESLALRKAFPAEMSGIYTKEEMEQAQDDDTPTASVVMDATHPVEAQPQQQAAPVTSELHNAGRQPAALNNASEPRQLIPAVKAAHSVQVPVDALPPADAPVTHERVNSMFSLGSKRRLWPNVRVMREKAEDVFKRKLDVKDDLAALKTMTPDEAHMVELYIAANGVSASA